MKLNELEETTARNAANYGAARTPYDSDPDANHMVFAHYKCTLASTQKELDHVKVRKTDLVARAAELSERRRKATVEARASLKSSITRWGVMLAIALIAIIVGLAANFKGPVEWAILGFSAALACLVATPAYHLACCVADRSPQPLIAVREAGLAWRERLLESRKQRIESYIEVQKARLNAIYRTYVEIANSLLPANTTPTASSPASASMFPIPNAPGAAASAVAA